MIKKKCRPKKSKKYQILPTKKIRVSGICKWPKYPKILKTPIGLLDTTSSTLEMLGLLDSTYYCLMNH